MILYLRTKATHALAAMLMTVALAVFSMPKFGEARETYDQKKNFEISASAIHQFDADLDGGGDFNVNRYFFQLDWTKRVSDTLRTGVGFHYDFHDYSFSEYATSRPLTTLDHLQSLGLGTSIIYTINQDWRLIVIPSIEASAESNADLEDSLIYGSIVSAGYRVTPTLLIGTGIGIFNRLEEVSYFPLVFIDWRITEQLRLSNPFQGGPSGPAGLELSYVLDESLELACGGAYRSFRFRLDDEGPASDGVFQEKTVPVWGRVTVKPGSNIKIDANAGAFLSGRFTIEDRNGHEISEEQYDAAPFLALTVSLMF